MYNGENQSEVKRSGETNNLQRSRKKMKEIQTKQNKTKREINLRKKRKMQMTFEKLERQNAPMPLRLRVYSSISLRFFAWFVLYGFLMTLTTFF